MDNIFNKIQKINLIRLFHLKQMTNTVFYLAVVFTFFIFNFVISNFPIRYDLSYGKAYTLSSSTKKILRILDDIVTIKFFVSSDLPTRLIPLKNEVNDLLNEYKKENKGRLNVKLLDPKKDQNALNEVQSLGLPQLQFSQLEQNKYAVSASYFGISISYGDKKELLPQVTDIESLEYNLTAAIYKLTKKELIKIGIVGKTESFDPNQDDIFTFKKVMKQQFDLNFIDLSSIKSIEPSYKTIIVFDDNKKEYATAEAEILESYINQGGKAIFFVDGIWVQENLITEPAKHNLFTIIKNFGISVNSDLILSANAELVNFGNSQISFLSPYPFWLRTNIFETKTSYFSNIQQLTFPWVSSLSGGKELIKTTNKSWEQRDSFILDPQSIPQPDIKDLKSFNIGSEIRTKNGGVILVIPSSRFVLERFLTRTSDNLEFVLNVVNDYASGGALSGIRQRAVSFYPLPDLPDNTKDLFKYANMFVLPLLFGLYGFLRLMKRR